MGSYFEEQAGDARETSAKTPAPRYPRQSWNRRHRRRRRRATRRWYRTPGPKLSSGTALLPEHGAKAKFVGVIGSSAPTRSPREPDHPRRRASAHSGCWLFHHRDGYPRDFPDPDGDRTVGRPAAGKHEMADDDAALHDAILTNELSPRRATSAHMRLRLSMMRPLVIGHGEAHA